MRRAGHPPMRPDRDRAPAYLTWALRAKAESGDEAGEGRGTRGAYVYMSLRRKARTASRTRARAASVRPAKFVQSMPSSMAEP